MQELNESINILLRSGTASDPYISIQEPRVVKGGMVYLSEIPEKFNRVVVTKLDTTALYETQDSKNITANQFYVNYKLGLVYFHTSRENETLNFGYLGRGGFFINGERIATKYDESGNIIETLDGLVGKVDSKIAETEANRQLAITATTNANTATTNANTAASSANTAALNAQSVADSNKNILLSPVANFAAIASTYPNPVFGSKVQTTDNGKIYRWDGTMWKYVEEMNSNIMTDIQVQLAEIAQYTLKTEAYGVEWDFVADTHARLGKAKGLAAGSAFNACLAFGGRKRCNLADNGTVNAYYGDPTYKEDGSNGQVMVEQPKFWYKREFTNRVIRTWVSDKEITGFKIYPAFIVDGVVKDKIYMSAFEASIFDVSAIAYLKEDEQVADFTVTTGDKLSSIANVKPASGLTQDLNIIKSRILANNRGVGWGLHNAHMMWMTQLLFHVEYASLNTQSAIGLGVTNKAAGTGNESEKTGQTSTLGNSSGMATGTNGLVSVTYRGEENFWGNIWTFVEGINIKDNVPYINTKNTNFISDKFDEHYKTFGFSLPKENGYQKKIHVANDMDYGFLPKEVRGSSSSYLADYYYQSTGNRVCLLGASWFNGSNAGGFDLYADSSLGNRNRDISARLAYI